MEINYLTEREKNVSRADKKNEISLSITSLSITLIHQNSFFAIFQYCRVTAHFNYFVEKTERARVPNCVHFSFFFYQLRVSAWYFRFASRTSSQRLIAPNSSVGTVGRIAARVHLKPRSLNLRDNTRPFPSGEHVSLRQFSRKVSAMTLYSRFNSSSSNSSKHSTGLPAAGCSCTRETTMPVHLPYVHFAAIANV